MIIRMIGVLCLLVAAGYVAGLIVAVRAYPDAKEIPTGFFKEVEDNTGRIAEVEVVEYDYTGIDVPRWARTIREHRADLGIGVILLATVGFALVFATRSRGAFG